MHTRTYIDCWELSGRNSKHGTDQFSRVTTFYKLNAFTHVLLWVRGKVMDRNIKHDRWFISWLRKLPILWNFPSIGNLRVILFLWNIVRICICVGMNAFKAFSFSLSQCQSLLLPSFICLFFSCNFSCKVRRKRVPSSANRSMNERS